MKFLSTLKQAFFLRLKQADNQITINSQGPLSTLHFALSDQNNKIQAGINLPIAFAIVGKLYTPPAVFDKRLWHVASNLRYKI